MQRENEELVRLKAELKENEKLMSEASRTWEERLRLTNEQNEKRHR